MNYEPSRVASGFCASILGMTATGKAFALVHKSALLFLPHPFLPGTFETYLLLGLISELAALLLFVLFGRRVFLLTCLGLSIVFIGYHMIQVGLGVAGPCPCIGGLLSKWKPLAASEGLLSFIFAVSLGLASFFGLFSVKAHIRVPSHSPSAVSLPAVTLAIAVWAILGCLVVALWHGRRLGGDEGMEAAKALQLLLHADAWGRVWNDQPPLLSFLGAYAFSISNPTLSAARATAVVLCLMMPLTLAVQYCQLNLRWAGFIAALFFWLALPASFASFMQEGPAYALGTAALLPLLSLGAEWIPLCLSAMLGAAALSIKLTAAFALVVPFVWLLQRSTRKALGWSFALIALTLVIASLLPGWSWATMIRTHVGLASEDTVQYPIQPDIYADNWLICALAVFALARRYMKNALASVIPWLSAALAAVIIHFLHRPYFGYYCIHLMAPVVVLAAIGLFALLDMINSSSALSNVKKPAYLGLLCVGSLWGWQRVSDIKAFYEASSMIEGSAVANGLEAIAASGRTAYSVDPIWTFTVRLPQTPPELTVLSLKRHWSGQIGDISATKMLSTNHVAALVVPKGFITTPEWSRLLADYLPTAESGADLLFVRKALHPTAIRLDDRVELLRELRTVSY